jgi:hypothetical protein
VHSDPNFNQRLRDEAVMDSQQFIEVIRLVVRDGAAEAVMSVLQAPPGRRPPKDMMERSKWYNSLDDGQKRILSSIVLDAANHAVFGFLCEIDGVRSIENPGEKGRLELRHVKPASVLLNPPSGPMLHELW